MTIDPEELERHVHRALGDLPAPRAPHTLRARVRAAVAPPMVGRPWFTWPWPLQVASAVFVIGAAGLLAWAWPMVLASLADAVPSRVQDGVGYVGGAAETSAALVRVMQLTWSAVVAPIAKVVLLLTVMLCTACALCVAALSRVALGGASQS